MRTWRGRGYALADCPDCGEREPSGDDTKRARQTAWARKHAEANPGHKVHVTTEWTRVYVSDAQPTDPER